MQYEIHVTVFPNEARKEEFKQACDKLGGHALFLQVAGAKLEQQWLFTTTVELHDVREAKFVTGVYAAAFSHMGLYMVIREKIEIKLSGGLPVEYFEAHWKINTSDEAALRDFANRLNLGFSANLTEPELFYLTRRSWSDYRKAETSFNDAHKLIEDSHWNITKVHYERVLMDTNPKIDEGAAFKGETT